MTAWRVGRYALIQNLDKVKILGYGHGGLRQLFIYEAKINNSKVIVSIELQKNSPALRYKVEADWQEVGVPGVKIPQLSFYLPFNYECESYKYDVPFGVKSRKPLDMDVPGNSFAYAECENSGLMVVTASKYGFRGYKNSISVDLVRSSYDPDPYPEFGKHVVEFAVIPVKGDSNKNLIDTAYDYNHVITPVSSKVQAGSLPAVSEFVALDNDNIVISAVKMPENGGKSIIARLYETEGKSGTAKITFTYTPTAASITDINENVVGSASITGKTISFNLKAYSIINLKISF
jgi:alpha-mannosidase